MEEHPYRTAGLVGAGLAAAGWIASRIARQRRLEQERERYVPPYTPRPASPSTPDGTRPGTTPSLPANPTLPRPSGPTVSAERKAEAADRIAIGTAMSATIKTPVQADMAEITALAGGLARALHAEARPGEDLATTTVRLWRQMETESIRSWGTLGVAKHVGDAVWEAVFLDAPRKEGEPLSLAAWTNKRATTLVTNERIGTDELLVRVAAAHAAVRKDLPNPLAPVIELWRRGVVPDVSRNDVVVRRDGVVVASAPRTPGKGREVA